MAFPLAAQLSATMCVLSVKDELKPPTQLSVTSDLTILITPPVKPAGEKLSTLNTITFPYKY